MSDSKGKHILYRKAQTRFIKEAKESDVKMQSVCIKIAIEYLEQELHSPSTKNDCTEIVPMHLYLYVRNVVMNLSRRTV